jgi:hypothetical protein
MTDLQFTQDIIRHDAAHMDAAEFQQFLDDNGIEHVHNEIESADLNNGFYQVILTEFADMCVTYHYGVLLPE